MIYMHVTFFFQRTQNTFETCLLTGKHLLSYKYDWHRIRIYVLVLEEVKLVFTLSSEHCRKERDGKNIAISESMSLLSKSYVCMDLNSQFISFDLDSCGSGH